MKYTEHKLTDAMLQRLSKISKGKPCGGMSVYALEARCCIVERPVPSPTRWEITTVGVEALAQARREGW